MGLCRCLACSNCECSPANRKRFYEQLLLSSMDSFTHPHRRMFWNIHPNVAKNSNSWKNVSLCPQPAPAVLCRQTIPPTLVLPKLPWVGLPRQLSTFYSLPWPTSYSLPAALCRQIIPRISTESQEFPGIIQCTIKPNGDSHPLLSCSNPPSLSHPHKAGSRTACANKSSTSVYTNNGQGQPDRTVSNAPLSINPCPSGWSTSPSQPRHIQPCISASTAAKAVILLPLFYLGPYLIPFVVDNSRSHRCYSPAAYSECCNGVTPNDRLPCGSYLRWHSQREWRNRVVYGPGQGWDRDSRRWLESWNHV